MTTISPTLEADLRAVLVEMLTGYDGIEVDAAMERLSLMVASVHDNGVAYGRLLGEQVVLEAVIESDPSMTSLIRWRNETDRKIAEAKAWKA